MLDVLTQGATVKLELAGLPSVELALDDKGPPSPLVKLLRPKVSVSKNGALLFQSAPYGEPRQGLPLGLIVLGGLAVVGFFLFSRR